MKEFLAHLSAFEIFLASKSPRRKQLLSDLGIPFRNWILEDVDESFPNDIESEHVAEYLSVKKAEPYKEHLKDGQIVITADTIVCSSDMVLGKPRSKDDAKLMLREISGHDHLVITGVSLTSVHSSSSFSATTRVLFDNLNSDEIDYYIDTYKPYDKAGSYGIQEWIGLIGVESIEGSYFNVMGLPIQRLYQELKRFTNYTKTEQK